MKFLNKNIKLVITFLIGALLSGGIVYAAVSASQISYIKEGTNVKTVEEALNDLYRIKNSIYSTPTLVGHGEISYSSGVTTETNVTGIVDDGEVVEISNNVFTAKKSGNYLIIYAIGSNINRETSPSYTGYLKLYASNEVVGSISASYDTYSMNYYIANLDVGDTLYATYRGDGDDYQKKAMYKVYYTE